MRALADHGAAGAQIMQRGDTPELFVLDANGIKVQLQDFDYRHGSGVKGDVLQSAPAATARPTFQLRTLNHVTLTVANGPPEKDLGGSQQGRRVDRSQNPTTTAPSVARV
jgi:hypothetical protein